MLSALPSHKRLPRSFFLFILINGLSSTVCATAELTCWLLHYPEVYYNPFFVGLRFYDFDSFQERFHFLHSAGFFDLTQLWPFAYPAPCALVYQFFFQFGIPTSLNLYLAFCSAIFLGVFVCFGIALVHRGLPPGRVAFFVGSGYLLAFPFWFLFQRANLEILVFVSLAVGLWAFLKNRGYTAAACFALAASFKIVPVLYFALFLNRRQYRQLAVALLWTGFITVASLWYVGPTIAQASHGISSGVVLFTHEMLHAPKPDSTGFDHSLFGIARRFLNAPTLLPTLYRLYTPSVALVGTGLYLWRIRRMPLLNQLLCLCLAGVWLTPVSFEYTLVHLYLGVGLLLLNEIDTDSDSGSVRDQHRPARYIFILLALLVSPTSEFILHGARFGGQVQSLLLFTLFIVVLLNPIQTRFDLHPSMRDGRTGLELSAQRDGCLIEKLL